ncbi:MAG: pilin, partial [Patescibacteria group bacterium]
MTRIQNKKIIFVFLIVLIIFGTFFVNEKKSQAVVEIKEYTVLAPLPGTTKGGGNCVGADCKADLASYIPGLFNLIIGLAAVVAVAYIIYGGFLYITTDAIMGKEEGKKHINNAIYGLIMISVAWLILYTINPRILEFKLNIGAITVPTGGGGTLGVNPCASEGSATCYKEGDTLQKLGAGITLNQPCTSSSCPTQIGGLT